MFSGKLFTIVSAVLAVAVNGSPIEGAGGELQARALGNVYFCVDGGFQGNCKQVAVDTNVCNNVPDGFGNDISSFRPDQGIDCTLFEEPNCAGKSIPLNYPGSEHLGDLGFDKVTASFKCGPP